MKALGLLVLACLLAACSSGTKSQFGRKIASTQVASCEVNFEGDNFKMIVNDNKSFRLTTPELKLEGNLEHTPKIFIKDVAKLLQCSTNDDKCIEGAIGAKTDPEIALGKYILDLNLQGVNVAKADEVRGYFVQGRGFYMGLYEVEIGSKLDKRLQYKSLMECQK